MTEFAITEKNRVKRRADYTDENIPAPPHITRLVDHLNTEN
jgi:hypothetical protein